MNSWSTNNDGGASKSPFSYPTLPPYPSLGEAEGSRAVAGYRGLHRNHSDGGSGYGNIMRQGSDQDRPTLYRSVGPSAPSPPVSVTPMRGHRGVVDSSSSPEIYLHNRFNSAPPSSTMVHSVQHMPNTPQQKASPYLEFAHLPPPPGTQYGGRAATWDVTTTSQASAAKTYTPTTLTCLPGPPVTQPPTLPGFPFLLEPNSHCFVEGPISGVLSAIRSALTSTQSDSTCTPNRPASWQAVKHCVSASCKFDINLWSTDESGRCSSGSMSASTAPVAPLPLLLTVVELVPRSGCRLLFASVLRSLVGFLIEEGCHITLAGGAPLPQNIAPPVVPTAPDVPASMSSKGGNDARDWENATTVLAKMLRDPCPDTKLEGARLAAQFSGQKGSAAPQLCSPQLISGLAGLLRSCALASSLDRQAPLIHCCAVLALSNLSEKVECQPLIVRQGLVRDLCAIAGRGAENSTQTPSLEDLQKLEVWRESARALANLCQDTSNITPDMEAVLTSPEQTRWLTRSDDICDERLRMHAQRVRRLLEKKSHYSAMPVSSPLVC